VGVNLRAVSLAEGVRAALSIAVIVSADEWLDWPPLMEAALAALLTCLCDSGGPIRKRLPALVSFAVLGASLTMGFGLARAAGYAVIPLACLGVFCGGFIRVFGQSAQQVGNLLTVVLVLSLDRAFPSLPVAATYAGAFVGGSAWAILLTMVVWRVYPNRPVRRAVADVYAALEALTADLRRLLQAPRISDQDWERHARAHRRAVRDTIEQARTATVELVRIRGAATERGAPNLIRLESADQIFGALIALSDVLEVAHKGGDIAAAERFLRLLRALLKVLAPVIIAGRTQRMARLNRSLDRLSEAARALPTDQLRGIADRIAERLRVTVTVSAPPGFLPDSPDAPPPMRLRDRLLLPIRANLNWQSGPLRHALRCAVVAAAGFSITFTWEGPYQHWLTIIMVMTMQPFFALTLQRALERIGGTLLGGALAGVLALICRTPLTMALALFPLAIITLSVRAASFGLFITFLTPMVVLLSELGEKGSSELTITAMRALYTIIGGLLAIGGCLFLWPSWEPDRLTRELRAAILAHGLYGQAELSLLLGEATAAQVEQVRRAAGVASNNLEASLSRALLEPRWSGGREPLQAPMLVDAALRRMAGRLTTMQLERQKKPEPTWPAWRDWIFASMSGLAADPPIPPAPRPPLHPTTALADALTRIARQIELIAGALIKDRDDSPRLPPLQFAHPAAEG
jgi:uncharacterized membrane protein YccC